MSGNYLLVFITGKCLLFVTLNLAVIVIGILVGRGTAQGYGEVVRIETEEWSKHPIVDVINTNATTCPADYELATGIFFGTQSMCNLASGGYIVGGCKSKSGKAMKATVGLSPTTFKKFDNSTVCIKRDGTLDYHKLVTMRD